MPMLTGDQYRTSPRDGRAAYMDGKRIDDATQNPLLKVSADWVAKTYDSHCSAHAGKHNPMYALPTTAAQLREQMNFLAASDFTAATTSGCMTLREILPQLGRIGRAYQERLERFLDRCRQGDRRVASAVEDGGIALASQLKIVERRGDGIVLRGAKRHVLGASVVHELLVVPSGALTAEQADAAVACAIEPNAAGLAIINITSAPRAEDDRHYTVSREFSVPDCYLMFEDVFIPTSAFSCAGKRNSPARASTRSASGSARAPPPTWLIARNSCSDLRRRSPK